MQIAVVKLPNLREYLILFNPSLLLSYKVQISLMPNAVLNTLFLEIFPGDCAPLAPAKGLAPGPRWGLRPQTPATACSLRSCFGRASSLRSPKAPPPKKKPGYVPVPISVFLLR